MNRKQKIAAALVVIGIVGGGAAAALWSSNGNGSGRAAAVTAQTVTVTAVTGTADLYPGFSGGDVSFTLTNTNPYPIMFTSMTAGAITSSVPSCPVSNITVAPATGLNLVVGAGATSGTLSINNVVTMSSGALDPCQGATFDIVLTLTGTQT